METELAFQTLIKLFNKSLTRAELAAKPYLEIVGTERQETLTFEQLKTRAQDFALRLIQARGVQIKDKIAILGKNRADWDVALWGIILAGAVPVLTDPERPVQAVREHLLHTDTRLIVMADDYRDADSRQEIKEFAGRWGLGLIEMTVGLFCNTSQMGAQLLNKVCNEIKADDTAVILCTSGVTADPREVELTHANLIANVQGTLEVVNVTSEDKLGHIIPPHHSFGLTVTKLLPLWVGAANVYTNRYRQISQLIKDKDITLFIGIPALFTLLAKKIEEGLTKQKQKKLLVRLFCRYLPSCFLAKARTGVGKRIIKKQGWRALRFFLSGAAPLPRWVLEVFWKRGLQLYEGYGTTENSPVYGFNSNPEKLGSVGKPIPTLKVIIVNEQNQTLQPGEKGEIVLGGPCIMKGYYKNPAATQAVIKTDNKGIRWLHTGDLGYLDKDEYLFIIGRKKYLIVLPGGKNVNPELVESALSRARYVKELLVIPDYQKDSIGIEKEVIKVIVRPDWDQIKTDTDFSQTNLANQPHALKNLIWQSINECQQKNRELAHFEKVSSRRLEIKIDEFVKTSTGKIKRDLYIKIGRQK